MIIPWAPQSQKVFACCEMQFNCACCQDRECVYSLEAGGKQFAVSEMSEYDGKFPSHTVTGM